MHPVRHSFPDLNCAHNCRLSCLSMSSGKKKKLYARYIGIECTALNFDRFMRQFSIVS